MCCEGRPVADHARLWAKHQSVSDPAHVTAAGSLRRARSGIHRPGAQPEVEVRCLADYDTELGTDLEGGAA